MCETPIARITGCIYTWYCLTLFNWLIIWPLDAHMGVNTMVLTPYEACMRVSRLSSAVQLMFGAFLLDHLGSITWAEGPHDSSTAEEAAGGHLRQHPAACTPNNTASTPPHPQSTVATTTAPQQQAAAAAAAHPQQDHTLSTRRPPAAGAHTLAEQEEAPDISQPLACPRRTCTGGKCPRPTLS